MYKMLLNAGCIIEKQKEIPKYKFLEFKSQKNFNGDFIVGSGSIGIFTTHETEKDCKVEASLGYTVSSKLAWAI